jgi:hypothetical protein
MSQEDGQYLSYLLRLWQTKREGEWVWRASLESARTGERSSFPDLEALCHYLRRETGVEESGQEEDSEQHTQ